MSNDVDMTKVEEEEEEWIVLDEWNDGDDEKVEGEITDDEVNHSAQTIYSSEDETNDRYNRFKNEQKANVMIEAPTGSGKTMAMLGAVREWITTRPSGKIYLCSRTHQQLDQMVAVAKAFIGDAAHISRLVGKDRVCLLEREVHSGNVPQLCSQHRASSTCRFTLNINLSGAILILDEAHNIETFCRDVMSLQVSRSQLQTYARRFSRYVELREFFEGLLAMMNDVGYAIVRGEDLLANRRRYLKTDNVSLGQVVSPLTSRHPLSDRLNTTLIDRIVTQFYYPEIFGAQGFAMFVVQGHQSPELRMTCMNSSYAMKSVSSCTHSIVLASGTLSPMSSYEKELGVFFTHKVYAKEHVVSKRHVFVRRISHSLKGDKEFYMNYSACQNEELLKAVGSVVYESTKILKKNVGETKAGVLCFFPSYKLLQTCRDVWRKVPLWAKLVKVVGGHLFLEDSENSDLLFDRYKTALIDGEPGTVALFLVVHRGKMSEGVDFSDSLARLVVSVGLPYPSYHSPDVKVKVEFNRSRGGNGDEWYKTQAMRAVNQSVGRCVRHVNDWGAVLLLDSRYFRPDVWSDLSHWVQVCEDESSTFKDTKKSLLELNSFLNGRL
ncbi:ATP-dependent DNA helicase chl1-like [Ixodes scapularis]|uniref:ATP-dependent DNA helicase chl1-like n=1 Tax=Ixodes scapularis TaxID=6945 RepID=UPI001C38E88C|nr:ATP-dependent DNA helicase chl1-like [Ixodes scapularis]